jgi:hypothetical protein
MADKRARCTKRRFKDRLAALMAMANIEARGEDRNGKVPKRAYLCPRCGGWHLTSQGRG